MHVLVLLLLQRSVAMSYAHSAYSQPTVIDACAQKVLSIPVASSVYSKIYVVVMYDVVRVSMYSFQALAFPFLTHIVVPHTHAHKFVYWHYFELRVNVYVCRQFKEGKCIHFAYSRSLSQQWYIVWCINDDDAAYHPLFVQYTGTRIHTCHTKHFALKKHANERVNVCASRTNVVRLSRAFKQFALNIRFVC